MSHGLTLATSKIFQPRVNRLKSRSDALIRVSLNLTNRAVMLNLVSLKNALLSKVLTLKRRTWSFKKNSSKDRCKMLRRRERNLKMAAMERGKTVGLGWLCLILLAIIPARGRV